MPYAERRQKRYHRRLPPSRTRQFCKLLRRVEDERREVSWLIAAGAAIGLTASHLLGRLAESQFYGISARDPLTLAGAALLIALVGLAAGLAPALRAMHIQPLLALRYE